MALYGNKIGFSDNPGERSSHKQITPKGGGIGILTVFLFFSVALNIEWTFWAPALIISLVSFWGDQSDIRPVFRLIIQFTVTILLVSRIWENAPIKPHGYLFGLPLVFFIVATANFYNFMDGINGIAGITGLIGFALLAFYAARIGADPAYIKLALLITLACLGFLPFNIPEARVFMGDVGSILLGFVFSGLALVFCRNWLDFFVMASFLFLFYADAITTIMLRCLHRDNLSRPHRGHLYQLLVNEFGIRHWRVSAGYGFVQLLVGITVICLCDWGSLVVLLFLGICFAFFISISFSIRKKTPDLNIL